jgi:glutamate synthase domain-containing protein 2
MSRLFLKSIIPIHAVLWAAGEYIHNAFWYVGVLTVPLTLLGIRDLFQTKHTILRNYPVLGHFRYLLEEIRPEIQQYFIERFDDGRPFSREQRSIVYQRAKGDRDTSAFGTQHNLYEAGTEWLEHAINTCEVSEDELRLTVGNEQCSKPYNASRFNISAMSYGSLSKNAVMALNWGAKKVTFFTIPEREVFLPTIKNMVVIWFGKLELVILAVVIQMGPLMKICIKSAPI